MRKSQDRHHYRDRSRSRDRRSRSRDRGSSDRRDDYRSGRYETEKKSHRFDRRRSRSRERDAYPKDDRRNDDKGSRRSNSRGRDTAVASPAPLTGASVGRVEPQPPLPAPTQASIGMPTSSVANPLPGWAVTAAASAGRGDALAMKKKALWGKKDDGGSQASQWQQMATSLGSGDRQAKFLKLMGARGKEAVPLSADGDVDKAVAQRNEDLEKQFHTALYYNRLGHSGLGDT